MKLNGMKWAVAALAVVGAAACEQGSDPTGPTGFTPAFSVTLPTTLNQGELVVCKDGPDATYTFDVTKNTEATFTANVSNGQFTLTVAAGVGECKQIATADGSGFVDVTEVDDPNSTLVRVDHYHVTGSNGAPVPVGSLTPPIGTVNSGVIGGDNGQLLVFINQADSNIPCTFTQGYWKNHPDAWPVSSLTLGTVTYTKAQLLSIFGAPVKGNGLISLAHQLITAKLNGATSSTPGIGQAIADADALIGSLVVPPVGAGYLAPSSTSSLIGTLDNWNNGVAGPGHCED